MTLQTERLRTIEQLEAFVAGSAPADCKPLDRESAYDFARRTLVAFDQMSGLATCETPRHAFEVHVDPRLERLAGISRSHVYNLRRSRTYRAKRTTWTKIKGSNVAIAVRKAPEPNGVPGFLRVDAVHQGDRDGAKGVYIVNLVAEATQHEYVGVVRGISERFLIPALEALLLMFPFPVLGFHADNGSEYINHRVVGLLQKLRIGEFTKSRARRCNDNALVEGKNAFGPSVRTGQGLRR